MMYAIRVCVNMFVIFTILKAMNLIDWSWALVMSPLCFAAIIIVVKLITGIVMKNREKKS